MRGSAGLSRTLGRVCSAEEQRDVVVARGDTIARGNGARRSSARFLHKKRGAQRQEAGSNPVAALRARHAFLAQHALHAPPPPPPRATYSYTITIFTEHLIRVSFTQVRSAVNGNSGGQAGREGQGAVEREVAAALAQRRKPAFSGDARSFS
ncbi:unnamed protein product [Chrysodeixis includens]|uniref:Uncharacterized protein n=1 Tax=Chrysodeixis includens TaxID=689277 RepID=A0A9N8PY87_CHRIL|nr:unnamed protein product [Chrysodeixis includens]